MSFDWYWTPRHHLRTFPRLSSICKRTTHSNEDYGSKHFSASSGHACRSDFGQLRSVVLHEALWKQQLDTYKTPGSKPKKYKTGKKHPGFKKGYRARKNSKSPKGHKKHKHRKAISPKASGYVTMTSSTTTTAVYSTALTPPPVYVTPPPTPVANYDSQPTYSHISSGDYSEYLLSRHRPPRSRAAYCHWD